MIRKTIRSKHQIKFDIIRRGDLISKRNSNNVSEESRKISERAVWMALCGRVGGHFVPTFTCAGNREFAFFTKKIHSHWNFHVPCITHPFKLCNGPLFVSAFADKVISKFDDLCNSALCRFYYQGCRFHFCLVWMKEDTSGNNHHGVFDVITYMVFEGSSLNLNILITHSLGDIRGWLNNNSPQPFISMKIFFVTGVSWAKIICPTK